MNPTTIGLVPGSARKDGMTFKLLQLVAHKLEGSSVQLSILDTEGLPTTRVGEPWPEDSVEKLHQQFEGVAGVVFLTPEYQGSFSALLKAIIENLGYPSILAGKPALALGVAGGTIGAIKSLEHLKSVLMHIGMMVLPLSISVASAHKAFAQDGQLLDPSVNGLLNEAISQFMGIIEWLPNQ